MNVAHSWADDDLTQAQLAYITGIPQPKFPKSKRDAQCRRQALEALATTWSRATERLLQPAQIGKKKWCRDSDGNGEELWVNLYGGSDF